MGHLVSRMHGGPGLGPRAAFWCAWSLWALSVVTTATALTYSAIHPLPAKIQGSLADGVIVVTFIGGFATVGALLAWKRAANPIGWLMCGTALSYAVGESGSSCFCVSHGRRRWATGWAGPGCSASASRRLCCCCSRPGRCPLVAGGRWRGPEQTGLAGWVLGNAFAPTIFSDDSHPVNPFGIGGVAGKAFVILTGGGAALVALSGAAAIVSLVFRYRHARTVEREQLKWLVYAAALIVVAHLASIGAAGDLQNAVTSGAVAIVPIAIGVAIFRYHLYDIDLVINKTLVYGSLAAFITGAYVAIVVGIGSLLQHRAQPSLGLSILATAVVAVAFQPVRARVQRLANRLVYGKRATPYEVLSEFSARMGETHATEDLLPQMAQLLADGTGAIRADVWLTDASELQPAASWPPDAERPRRVACEGGTVPGVNGTDRIALVRHHGEFLGALSVTKRPGESLTPTDDKLISDLASRRPGPAECRPHRAAPRTAGGTPGLPPANRRRARRRATPDRAQHPRWRPAPARGPSREAGPGRVHRGTRRRAATGAGRAARSRGLPSPADAERPCSWHLSAAARRSRARGRSARSCERGAGSRPAGRWRCRPVPERD